MGRLHHQLLLLLLLLLVLATMLSFSSATAVPTRPDVEFVRSSCRSTRYPALCEQCLAGYAGTVRRSPRQLANAALTVTLARAQSASAFVGRLAPGAARPPGGGAVRDCVDTVRSSVDQLQRSLRELQRMGRPGTPRFAWCLSNVQTWVSAALTDQTTCLDGLSGAARLDPRLRAAIRGRIVDLTQVTSNALALVNRIAPKY